jgi:uncharacterized membrane protein (UPF0127 family)
VQVDGHSIKTEVVGTEAARQKGLSGRPCIKDNQAMLFVFETNDTTNHCFWMKDMRFAIDMVWLDANKRVVYRVLDVQPNTYPHSFCPGLPTRYVLEVKAHTADKLGLAVGTRTFF